jgi:hypothetical protein
MGSAGHGETNTLRASSTQALRRTSPSGVWSNVWRFSGGPQRLLHCTNLPSSAGSDWGSRHRRNAMRSSRRQRCTSNLKLGTHYAAARAHLECFGAGATRRCGTRGRRKLTLRAREPVTLVVSVIPASLVSCLWAAPASFAGARFRWSPSPVWPRRPRHGGLMDESWSVRTARAGLIWRDARPRVGG